MQNIDKNIDKKIITSLEKISQVQRILLWDIAKKENLSPIQIQFLIFLNESSEEMRKVSILAEEFDLTKATVSDAVRILEEKKLLKKYQQKEDKRSYLLELSEKGLSLVKRISNWQNPLIDIIHNLPIVQKEETLSLLLYLIKNLFKKRIVSIAKICLTCENYEERTGKNGQVHFCKLLNSPFQIEDVKFECGYYQKPE